MNDLATLNQKWMSMGFGKKPVGIHMLQLAAHLAMSLGGIAAFVFSPFWPVKLLGLFFSTCGTVGVSTHAHMASHNAIANSTKWNQALTYFGFPVYLGLSASYWWNKHVSVHHPTPNIVGLDDDIDLMPFFALTPEEAARGGPLKKLWFRVQGWFIVPALAGNGFNIQKTGWVYLLGLLKDPSKRKPAHWMDLGLVLSHYVLWVGVPCLFFPPLSVVAFYVVRMFLVGYGMFVAFAPAHFPAEARFVGTEGEADRLAYKKSQDFVLLQTATTVNFRTGWFGRLVCIGVEYQIEHHLFPGISHVYYPKMAPILKEYCDANGYPYKTLGWWEGTWKAIAAFWRIKPVAPRLEELRASAAANHAA